MKKNIWSQVSTIPKGISIHFRLVFLNIYHPYRIENQKSKKHNAIEANNAICISPSPIVGEGKGGENSVFLKTLFLSF
jgi:hypothetical protein